MNNNELTKEIAFRLRIRAAIDRAVKSVFTAKKESKPKQVRTYNNVPDRAETAIIALQQEIKKNIAHGK